MFVFMNTKQYLIQKFLSIVFITFYCIYNIIDFKLKSIIIVLFTKISNKYSETI